MTLFLKSKYLKDKQPPAVGAEDMVQVDVDVDILQEFC